MNQHVEKAVFDTADPDLQSVTSVTHWTDRLFSFRVTRPPSLRFRSGEFTMIGLPGENGKQLLRAYSIASANWDDEIEFYSIKVPNGPLTSRLQHLKIGDQVIVRTKPVGTLVLDALLPGKRAWLIATGTGIAPFASLLRDPELYERYEQVILTHTCRTNEELDYSRQLVSELPGDILVGEMATEKLQYYPTTTQAKSRNNGRISDLLRNGRAFQDLNTGPLQNQDRVMICGSMALNLDMKEICQAAGLEEGSNSKPGSYVVEKAFVG